VWGSGFRVQGAGFRVQGSGLKVQDSPAESSQSGQNRPDTPVCNASIEHRARLRNARAQGGQGVCVRERVCERVREVCACACACVCAREAAREGEGGVRAHATCHARPAIFLGARQAQAAPEQRGNTFKYLKGFDPERQSQNVGLTVLCMAYALDSGPAMSAARPSAAS